MHELYVTVGLPRSGKSTWALKASEQHGWPIVCPDSVRLALHGQRYQQEAEDFVWAITKTMVRALFLAGHTGVILDTTNTTEKRRKVWMPRSSDPWDVTNFVPILAKKEECIKRANDNYDALIVPVIERMAEAFQVLTPEEPMVTAESLVASVDEDPCDIPF